MTQSEKMIRRWKHPAFRSRMISSITKRWKQREFRKLMSKATSESMKRRIRSNPAQHQKISELGGKAISQKFATDIAFRDRVAKAARKNIKAVNLAVANSPKLQRRCMIGLIRGWEAMSGARISKAQLRLYEVLWKIEQNLILEHPVLQYRLDIALVSRKLGIEVDSSFHDVESDAVRDRRLRGLGWRILRIPYTWGLKHRESCLQFLRKAA